AVRRAFDFVRGRAADSLPREIQVAVEINRLALRVRKVTRNRAQCRRCRPFREQGRNCELRSGVCVAYDAVRVRASARDVKAYVLRAACRAGTCYDVTVRV